MNTAIIVTGSEITTGLVQDSNSQFIAQKLSSLGYNITNIYICNDKKENIKDIILKAVNKAELIFITGGLGPTKDDLSREAFAEALGLKLEYSKEIENNLKGFFSNHNSQMTANNLSQAYLPEGGQFIANKKGTAPALKINYNDQIFYLLPGVPRELKDIFNRKIYSDLKSLSHNKTLIKEFNFIGIGESTLAAEVDKLKVNPNLKISYQAGKAEVKLRIKLNSSNQSAQQNEKILSDFTALIRKKFSDYLYSEDQKSIMDKLHLLLIKKKLKIAAVESFTGGLIAERLTQKSGSSNYFQGALTAYNRKIKEKLLKVNPEIINKYGVVSRECAAAMAKSGADLFNSDLTISTTGAAGPGAHDGQSAGTMFIAVNFQNDIRIFKLNKNYGRELNRYYASQFALFESYKMIKKREEK